MIDLIMNNLDVILGAVAGVLATLLALSGKALAGLVNKSETKLDDKLAVALLDKLVEKGLLTKEVADDLKVKIEA